ASGARNPAQNQGVQVRRIHKAVPPASPQAGGQGDTQEGGGDVDDLVQRASHALETGDEDSARALIAHAMAVLASEGTEGEEGDEGQEGHPAVEENGPPDPGPDGRAGRDPDGDGRVDGEGLSDEPNENPAAQTIDEEKANLHD